MNKDNTKTIGNEVQLLKEQLARLNTRIKELEGNKSITKLDNSKLCDHRYKYNNVDECYICGYCGMKSNPNIFENIVKWNQK